MGSIFDLKSQMPSLGYFGSKQADALRIDIGISIDRLKILVPCEDPTILNLMGLQFVADNSVLDISTINHTLDQSSTYQDNQSYGANSLLRNTGIHTKSELNPYWSIGFERPLHIDSVILYNRPDFWGSRSWPLECLVHSADGWERVYSADSWPVILNTYEEVRRVTCETSTNIGHYNSLDRKEILSLIAASITHGSIDLKTIEWRRLYQFVDFEKENVFSPDEIALVAAKILSDAVNFDYGDLSNFLIFLKKIKTINEMDKLQNRINEISRIYGYGDYTISHHGLNKSILRSKKDLFIELIFAVQKILGDAGFPSVLSYGTLLGARRDGQFIAHDDDVDMLYLLPVETENEAVSRVKELSDHFIGLGYGVKNHLPHGLNLHIIDKTANIAVDVFPCWVTDSEVTLHMEKMRLRQVPADIMFPASELTFYGRKFPVPRNTDEFLRQRYGENWRVPLQYFEWPWNLESGNGV